MILGLLSLPFRLLGFALMLGALYLGWTYRADLKRWVHRVTAEPGGEPSAPKAAPVNQAAAEARATRRLDSLAKRRADSVVLSSDELAALIAVRIKERAGAAIDSVAVELGDGELAMTARVDPGEMPRGTLGPLAEWIPGRETVEAKGPFGLRRLGQGEWRITEIKVRGLPLPRAVWSRLLPGEGAVGAGSIGVPLETWVTGVRVTPGGVILYGKAER